MSFESSLDRVLTRLESSPLSLIETIVKSNHLNSEQRDSVHVVMESFMDTLRQAASYYDVKKLRTLMGEKADNAIGQLEKLMRQAQVSDPSVTKTPLAIDKEWLLGLLNSIPLVGEYRKIFVREAQKFAESESPDGVTARELPEKMQKAKRFLSGAYNILLQMERGEGKYGNTKPEALIKSIINAFGKLQEASKSTAREQLAELFPDGRLPQTESVNRAMCVFAEALIHQASEHGPIQESWLDRLKKLRSAFANPEFSKEQRLTAAKVANRIAIAKNLIQMAIELYERQQKDKELRGGYYPEI